ncbi:MAG TPA: hypothetical protein VMH87_00245 [Pseudomonadales bacterium]|nr:hypothetical protein [Pseudomonadales bacterium]
MNPLTIPEDAIKRFRDAATRFTRDASPRASRLLAVKDDIAALRKKGASFRTIGELLAQNGIAASDTCVMRFCQRELGEKPTRNAKRKSIAAPKPAPAANGHAVSSAPLTKAAQAVLLDNLLSAVPANVSSKPTDEGGPRIARIEFAKPGEL